MTEPDTFAELDATGRAIYEDWKAAKVAVEQWSDRRDELAGLLAERLGKANKATIDGRHVVTRIPPTTVSRFDERRFHESYPDMWADFVVPSHRAGHLRLVPTRAERSTR